MKIKNILLILIPAALLGIASCEDVIQLDLKDAASRLVIDASMDATEGNCTVLLSKSISFYQTDTLIPMTGAKVELSGGGGLPGQLAEISPGSYKISGLTVPTGTAYTLKVTTADGISYVAETKVPAAVRLDSVTVIRGFGDPRPTSPPVFILKTSWRDPAGTAEYYRFVLTKNGKTRNGSFNILDDASFDGGVADLPQYRYSVKPGDTISLEFQSIDSASFHYFSQINDMARPSFVSATPYNPVGNFSNGALGYFGIHFSDVHDLIVRPGR